MGQAPFPDGESSKKGFHLSHCALFSITLFYIGSVLLVGLLVGLVGRPTCTKEVPDVPPTAGPTANPSQDPWINDRLPPHLVPEHYVVDLRPDFDYNTESDAYLFYGTSSVRYLCKEPTKYLILHTFELTYPTNSFEISDESGTQQTIERFFFFEDNDYLVLETVSPCQSGAKYTFKAPSFHGELGDDLYGLYKSEYVNEEGENRVIAVTQMETIGARRTFPCFDEPGLKATFDIILRHRNDQGYYGISNMPVVSYEVSEIDGVLWNASVFAITPIMPTYLLAFAVCDFTYNETFTTTGVQTRIYARKEAVDNGDADYAAYVTPRQLIALGDKYNIPYDLPKSDQLAAPDFNSGAMENWGLVLYREPYLLWDPAIDTIWNKYSVTSIIGHELAHQWFGNLVSCAWWNEIWLNEGFATYVSYIGVESVQPEWKIDELFVVDDLQVALRADDQSSSHALVHPEGRFSSISYSKGGSVIRMINDFLGEPTFTQALTNYLNKYAYGPVVHQNLFESWIEEAEKNGLEFPHDLMEILESWTLQMGYPLVSVTRKDSSSLSVSQSYFLISTDDQPNYEDSEGSAKYRYKWYIPFSYKTESNIGSNDFSRKWMPAADDTVDIPVTAADKYILANIDAKGVYRVWYEDDIFKELVTKLKGTSFADISPQNRAQLVDDAFNLVSASKTLVKRVFEISSYMFQELSYIVWESFLDELLNYDDRLSGSALYADFRTHILSLVVPSIYTEYGWDDSDTSDAVFLQRATRELAIEYTCYYGNQWCLGNATNQLHWWMTNPSENRLTRTYRTEVYCYGIKESGIDEWNFMVEQYGKTQDVSDQRNMLYGLSCTEDPWILNLYLQWALDGNNLPRSELYRLFAYVAGHEHGKYVALNFAYNNWNDIFDIPQYGQNALDYLLSYAVSRLSTEYDTQLLESFKTLVVGNQAWTDRISYYISLVESSMEWRMKHEQDIADWLGSKAKLNIPTLRARRYKAVEPDDINNGFKRKYLKYVVREQPQLRTHAVGLHL